MILKQRWSEGFLGHDVVKVFFWDFSAIAGCSLQHFLKFLDAHCFSQLLCHSLYIVNVYGSALIIVEQLKNFVDPILYITKLTLDSLSPNFDVIASRNSSKSIYLPSLSNYVIIWKIVGFLDSNPRLCMADLSYLSWDGGTWDQFCQWLRCQRGWRLLWVLRFNLLWVQDVLFFSWLVLFHRFFPSFEFNC